jgi:uncharacterized membrane protein
MDSKLQKELSELLQNNIITDDVAQNILAYYQSKNSESPNRLFVIFGVLGSVLVGLGIILILAHNWDHFSKAVKTIFAFLPLLIGQGLSGYAILKKKSVTWREASGTFLFFAIGSSIALVSQIYNIPGDLSSYVLTWTILGLPLIYLLRSNALAVLCLVFATYYAIEYGYAFLSNSNEPWLYFGLLAAILPFYFALVKSKPKSNMTSIFNWLVPLSFIIVLGAFVRDNDDLGFLMYIVLFGLLYNIGKIPLFNTQKLRRNGYLILGSLGTVVMLLVMSFNFKWYDIMRLGYSTPEFEITIVLLFITLSLILYSYSKKWITRFNPFQYVFVIFSFLVFTGLIHTMVASMVSNILVLVLGLMTIKTGADKLHFGILNYGLFIITALIVCRFFDTDMSFVIRGLLFVCVGAGFFITNYVMLKRQKENLNQKLNS